MKTRVRRRIVLGLIAAAATAAAVACLGPDPSLLPPGYDGGAAADATAFDAPAASDAGCGVCAIGLTCYEGVCGGGVVRQVSSGNGFACAVVNAGEVWCWGSSANGKLGTDVTAGNRAAPVKIEGLANIDKVSLGDSFACAHRQTDAAILCWGKNDSLQLGHDPTAFQDSLGPFNAMPVAVQGLPPAIDVEVGGEFACAWNETDTYCWGANTEGQLAIDKSTAPSAPVKTPLGPVVAMALSIDLASPNGCALRADKTAVCWGANDSQQRGDDAGSGSAPVVMTGLRSIESVGSGSGVNCAVNGSTLTCAGENRQGELGERLPAASPVFVASYGPIHQLSLRTHTACAIDGTSGDGVVRCWGTNARGQVGDGFYTRAYDGGCDCEPAPTIVEGVAAKTKFQQVSAGTTNTVALASDGTVWAWGSTASFECGETAADAGVANCLSGTACQPTAEPLLGFPR